MRALTALLFVALLVGVVWSFAVAPEHGWWMPASASSIGRDVDRLFGAITILLGVAFVGVVGWLAFLVWRGTRATSERAVTNHGSARLEGVWTLVTGAILLTLALVQLSLWHTMQAARASDDKPLARVQAAQFEWRFRYPGADGRFDTADDFDTPYRLVVPLGERVTLELRSRDVIHGFFVPAFRLKQDVLPGSALKTWFVAEKAGEFDLVCTQLCGAGHYRMAGKIEVVSRAEFDVWNESMQRALHSNGKEKP